MTTDPSVVRLLREAWGYVLEEETERNRYSMIADSLPCDWAEEACKHPLANRLREALEELEPTTPHEIALEIARLYGEIARLEARQREIDGTEDEE